MPKTSKQKSQNKDHENDENHENHENDENKSYIPIISNDIIHKNLNIIIESLKEFDIRIKNIENRLNDDNNNSKQILSDLSNIKQKLKIISNNPIDNKDTTPVTYSKNGYAGIIGSKEIKNFLSGTCIGNDLKLLKKVYLTQKEIPFQIKDKNTIIYWTGKRWKESHKFSELKDIILNNLYNTYLTVLTSPKDYDSDTTFTELQNYIQGINTSSIRNTSRNIKRANGNKLIREFHSLIITTISNS